MCCSCACCYRDKAGKNVFKIRNHCVSSLCHHTVISLVKSFLYRPWNHPIWGIQKTISALWMSCVNAMSLSIAVRTAHAVLHNHIIMEFCADVTDALMFLLPLPVGHCIDCDMYSNRLWQVGDAIFFSHASIKIPPFHGGCCAKWCQLPESRQKVASKGFGGGAHTPAYEQVIT